MAVAGWNFEFNEPFLRAALEVGRRDDRRYFDVMNIHYNDRPLDATVQGVERSRALLDEYGVGDLPMWNTEWGTYAGAPPPRQGRLPYYIVQKYLPQTARDQAAYEIKGITMQYHLGLERVFAATLGDIKPPGMEVAGPSIQRPPEAVFTHHLIFDEFTRPGRPLLMFYTLRLFMERLDAFISITRIEADPGNNAFRYDFGGESGPTVRSRYVVWNDVGGEVTLRELPGEAAMISATIADSDRSGFAKLRDRDAHFPSRRRRIVDGQVTLRLKTEPLLVELV